MVEEVPRSEIKSKIKNKIFYLETEISNIDLDINLVYKKIEKINLNFNEYIPISEFPSSSRDFSFSITKFENVKKLIDVFGSVKHENIKEVFMFDYFYNAKQEQIKVGYRFIFQSNKKTLNDIEVDLILKPIIERIIDIDGITIPMYDN